MKTLKLATLVLFVCMGSISMAGTQLSKPLQGKWDKLGTRIVNMKADHDVINVTFHEGFYTKVKFGVRKADLHLKNINIVFGNGQNKNVVFNKRFTAGSSTRIIDLPGNKRIIKKIKLNYKSIPGGGNGKAVVVAWGRH